MDNDSLAGNDADNEYGGLIQAPLAPTPGPTAQLPRAPANPCTLPWQPCRVRVTMVTGKRSSAGLWSCAAKGGDND